MTTRLSVAAVCVVFFLTLGVTRLGLSVGHAAQPGSAGQTTVTTQRSPMDMTKMDEQMLAEMKTAEGRLDALVNDMNAATGEARIMAMAAVVNELALQHKAMRGHMMSGCCMMMRH
jgi:hypothetical protein